MKFNVFGPTRQDADQMAYQLIVLHGLGAYDEAVRLSEVARTLARPNRQSKLYRMAAEEIDRSFKIAWRNVRGRAAAKPHILDLVGRLNTQGLFFRARLLPPELY
jgi:transposase